MKSKIITLATSKGGVGKSTLTRSIAAYLSNLKHKILIIDSDTQGAIINRHNPRGKLKNIEVIAEASESVAKIMDTKQCNYDYILVDTGGLKNRTTIRSLIKSDLVLIPLKASVDDVAGAIDTHNLINELNKTPERSLYQIQYRMILTMTHKGMLLAKHVRKEFAERGYLLIENEMYHRVIYSESAIKGLSPCVTEPRGLASNDISKIITEIKLILHKV